MKIRKPSRGFSQDFKTINYKTDVIRPIEPAVCTAWLVILPTGQQRVLLWHKDATLEDVHHHCGILFRRGFKLGRIDVGDFIIRETDTSMRMDSRFVDQDWNVSSGWKVEK